MIKLIFTINREIFIVKIIGKEVFYQDRKMSRETRMIPPDLRIQLKISRNIVPKFVAEQFNLTPEELAEYEKCSNEEELSKVCISDCLKNGAILEKKEVL